MPDTSHRTRVVVIAEPGPLQQQITSALGSQPDFQLLDILTSLDKLAPEIRAAQPNIILIDHQMGGQPTLDALDELALHFPEVALLAILPSNDPLQAQQVMLAGAQAFLIQPFTQVNLLSTLRRVRDLQLRRQQTLAATTVAGGAEQGSKPLKILTVYGPRGGVGSSTVAVNLAIALREETDQRVLLLDGKLLFGHLGVMLNIRVPNSIADLVPHMHALDDAMIRDVAAEHVSGIHVLLSPSQLEVAQGIRAEALYHIVNGLRLMYDFIVIDAGSFLNDHTVTLLDAADRILLVTTPDLAALHDASRFVQLSRSLAYPAGKIAILLNRSGLLGGVKASDIETALHHELFAQIPDDGPNALRSVNRGIPILLKYPRSPASRAIQKLAKTLAAIGTEEPANVPAGPPPRAAKRARLALSRPGKAATG